MRLTRLPFLCAIALFAVQAFANISVQKLCTPDAFVNDTFTSTVTVTNNGSSPLTNIVVIDSDGGTLSIPGDTLPAGGSYSWTIPLSSPTSDPHTSSVTASTNDETASADCTTNVWELNFGKTASTSYTRDWRWTLTKTPDSSSTITIARGTTVNIGFTVSATTVSVDSGWKVSGVVMVSNPAPISATVTSLTDRLSDNTPVALQCGRPAPYVIPAGGSLSCTYSINRSGPINGTNNATATMANNNGGSTTFDASADYVFGAPTSELHANASVVDTGATVANADNTGSTGWSFVSGPMSAAYVAPNGGSFHYNVPVTNVSAACDTAAGVINGAALSDGEHFFTVGATAQITSGACGGGDTGGGGGTGVTCTSSIGYWKTHAGFTGRNADRVTAALPQWLGTSGGAKSVKVTTATQAVTLLSFSGEASNGVNKLYGQLLAAKLNIFRGASPAAVSSVIATVDAFLASNNSADWAAMNKNTQKQVNTWMSTFDQYNNGLIGPGHCD